METTMSNLTLQTACSRDQNGNTCGLNADDLAVSDSLVSCHIVNYYALLDHLFHTGTTLSGTIQPELLYYNL